MDNSQDYGQARNGLLARVLSILTILAVLVSMWAFAAPQTAGAVGNIPEIHDEAAPNVDARAGRVQPTSAQLSTVSRLGATVRWNKFGTPHSMIKYGGYLATGLSGATAKDAAFNWIVANQGLFRLANVNTNSLRLLNDSRMTDGYDPATGKTRYTNGDGHEMHAVMFRQYFGGVPATRDGMITVGIVGTPRAGWKIAYVSSSLTGASALAAQPALTARQAWLLAAKDVGKNYTDDKILHVHPDKNKDGSLRSNWTLLNVKGLSNFQRVRRVALPTPTQGVRPAYEVLFIQNDAGKTEAYTSHVDAVTGEILVRVNNVQQFANHAPAQAPLAANPTVRPFTGAYSATACGPSVPATFTVGQGVQSITVIAQPVNPANDIVIELVKPDGSKQRQDLLTSPEVLTFAPRSGVPAGTYRVNVCPFTPETNTAPFNFSGAFITDAPSRSVIPYPPRWKYFRSNPSPIGDQVTRNRDSRILACWDAVLGDIDGNDGTGTRVPGCQQDLDYVGLRSSKAPWDQLLAQDTPSFTMLGNNAVSAEAHLNANDTGVVVGSFGPGPTGFRPFSLDRNYSYQWRNEWNTARCNPSVIGVERDGPDLSAAVTNLFVQHNRMHDWSYHLGFTEENFNLQQTNFGNGNPDRALDPETGVVQSGAITGSSAGQFTGRDNANQFTPQDGVTPITNMYLWQPIAAAYYAPCVDGDFDFSVIAHEYGHAIQNRMVGGPDESLSSNQGGAMGESWADLTAIEINAEFGYSMGLDPAGYPRGVNPFSVGAYVTGDPVNGIRNYGMNFSPLNYSNLNYDPTNLIDTTGHANGEIWSATNYRIRQILVEKYNVPRFGYPAFPVTDKLLQQDCAAGRRPARFCPGNRRWVQIFHDAFLLLPGNISMLDARDAYLAADMMRFSGFNQVELWRAFARSGMGFDATTPDPDAGTSTPSFRSPRENSAVVTFDVRATRTGDPGTPVKAKIYVGDYEARSTPYADTFPADRDPKTPELANTTRFVQGTYRFLVVAPGYGFYRFTRSFTPGQVTTVRISMAKNFAAKVNGSLTRGDGLNKNRMFDETERSNWASLDPVTRKAPTALGDQVGGKQVTVDLAGATPIRVTRVNVSALTRVSEDTEVGASDDGPEARAGVEDTGRQSTFTAVRQFEILTCVATAADPKCNRAGGFTRALLSSPNAFPAGRPRPSTADLILRPFTLPEPKMATHVMIKVISNQCTGAPDYQGDQESDPTTATTDCSDYNGGLVSTGGGGLPALALSGRQNNVVRISELQVFATDSTAR